MKGLILFAFLQNSTLMIHHSVGDDMSCSVREKLSMTVMPGEERVHPSLVSLEEFSVTQVGVAALCDVRGQQKVPAPLRRRLSSPGGEEREGKRERLRSARVWVQHFPSVMNRAIINRRNVKLHLRYETERESFPQWSWESSRTRAAQQVFPRVLVVSISKLGHGQTSRHLLFLCLSLYNAVNKIIHFPTIKTIANEYVIGIISVYYTISCAEPLLAVHNDISINLYSWPLLPCASWQLSRSEILQSKFYISVCVSVLRMEQGRSGALPTASAAAF